MAIDGLQAIDERMYGPDHPEIATGLNSWASLLTEEVRAVRISPASSQGSRMCGCFDVWYRHRTPLLVGDQGK